MLYLDLDGVERLTAIEVLRVAVDQENDHLRAFYKNVQVAVRNGIAEAFKRG